MGGFECFCQPGYKLHWNKKDCVGKPVPCPASGNGSVPSSILDLNWDGWGGGAKTGDTLNSVLFFFLFNSLSLGFLVACVKHPPCYIAVGAVRMFDLTASSSCSSLRVLFHLGVLL